MNLDALVERILAIDSFVWQPFVMPPILVVVGGLITDDFYRGGREYDVDHSTTGAAVTVR